jgi:hypothetical protein
MAQHDDAPLADVLAEIVADTDTKALFRRLLEQALNQLIETELSIVGATRSASDSRVNSSTTCRILIVRPVAVTSNW